MGTSFKHLTKFPVMHIQTFLIKWIIFFTTENTGATQERERKGKKEKRIIEKKPQPFFALCFIKRAK